MSEFRKDPIRHRWVIMDDERPLPKDMLNRVELPETIPERDPDCPFCPGNEKLTGKELLRFNFIQKEQPNWDLRVVPNRMPILRVETQMEKAGEGVYDWMSGVGADEIIIESPFHNDLSHHMAVNRVEQVFWSMHDRILDLKKDERLRYTLFFKRFGRQAGDSFLHPHSRMLATPFVPLEVEAELAGAEEFFELKERCVFCDMVRQELKDGSRIIAVNDGFIAMAPYASIRPYEVWIMPRSHQDRFDGSTKSLYFQLAEMCASIHRKLFDLFGAVPFIQTLHDAPLQEMDLPYFHWHIELVPLLTCTTASQADGSLFINPVLPEDAAADLRNAGG